MGKPRQRAADILGLQHQSGRCGSRASRRTSKESIANGGRSTASAERFHNFREALDYVEEVGELAETEGYHPSIQLRLGSCDCLSEYREDQRNACERLHRGEWLLDRPDWSLAFKQ